MLKALRRYIRQMKLVIEQLPQDGSVIELRCASPEKVGHEIIDVKDALYAKYGCMVSTAPNPNYYTECRANISALCLPPQLEEAVSTGLVYTAMEKDTGGMVAYFWITFLACVGGGMGHMPIICAPPHESGSKKKFLHLQHGDSEDFRRSLDTIGKALGVSLGITLHTADVPALQATLLTRLEASVAFYLDTEPEWTQNFYECLGDDLSRASLINFLRQRIWAKTYWHSDDFYTLSSPVESAAWRRERLQKITTIPSLTAPATQTLPFFYINTFVFEQYAIPGVVEAMPGNVVFDVGAGFGDTVVYFSQKMQNTGKIYAFDPIDTNISSLKANCDAHGCNNVIIMPLALSDIEGKLTFDIESEGTSTGAMLLQDCDFQPREAIRAVPLDMIVQQERTRVDFIKADIEGMELSLLKGARKTLQRDKPNCALALYHRQEDFRTLPQFLQSVCHEYTFYVRCDAEPMLFAKAR